MEKSQIEKLQIFKIKFSEQKIEYYIKIKNHPFPKTQRPLHTGLLTENYKQ